MRYPVSAVKYLEVDAVNTKRGICDEILVDKNIVIACTCHYNYCNVGNNVGPNVVPKEGPKEVPNVANTTTNTGILFIILFSMFCQKLLMK